MTPARPAFPGARPAPYTALMTTVPPFPRLEGFATEDAQRTFVAGLRAAEKDADRIGCVSLEQVDAGMRAAIRKAAERRP